MEIFVVLLTGIVLGGAVYAYVGHRLSGRYPILIFCNMMLCLCIYIIEGMTIQGMIFCLTTSVLLVIGVIDWFTFEIPMACNVVIGILGIIHLALDRSHALEYLAGALTVSLLFLLVYVLTKGQGIGGGDIKLMAAAGLLVGWKQILLALFVGSVIGSVIHLSLMKWQKRERILAFGPYLAVGIFVSMLWGKEIISWYLAFFA